MARVRAFLGDLSGKIGDVVVVNGKNGIYVRSLPRKNDRKSERQLIQRGKLQKVNAFLKPIKDFLSIGFVQRNPKQNPYQAAVSCLLSHAFVSDVDNAGDLVMDAKRVMVCQGSLAVPIRPSFSLSDHVMIIRWEDCPDTAFARSDDRLVVLLYDPDTGEHMWEVMATTRKDKYHLLLTPNDMKGCFWVFMAFVSAKGDLVSNSVYLGEAVLEERSLDADHI